jgi:hypothetical protein
MIGYLVQRDNLCGCIALCWIIRVSPVDFLCHGIKLYKYNINTKNNTIILTFTGRYQWLHTYTIYIIDLLRMSG